LHLVLVEPQDLVNIASAVRIARNFGLDGMRLVRPREFDAWRIEGIAHNTADFVATIRQFDSLEDALADCRWSLGLTARGRAAKRTVLDPRPAALDAAGARKSRVMRWWLPHRALELGSGGASGTGGSADRLAPLIAGGG
jgi:tRNA C32,U32 (ribose-2'-O)-methylase TrmJ